MKKNKAIKNSGLGSGLSSLLGSEFEKKSILSEENVTEKYKMIPIEFIEPGPWQPRKSFDKNELESLSKSITKQGVIQPIILKSKQASAILRQRRHSSLRRPSRTPGQSD